MNDKPELYNRIQITIPLPPSVNHMYRNGSKPGAKYKTGAYRRWEEEAGYIVLEKASSLRIAGRLDQFAPPIALEAWFFFPDRRRTDADNRCKALQDLLANVLKFDDSAIIDVVLHKRIDRKGARCEVVLEEVSMDGLGRALGIED